MSSKPATLAEAMRVRAVKLEGFLDRYFGALGGAPGGKAPASPIEESLLAAMRYSLLQPGAKRFRPVLAMLTAEALGKAAEHVLPFAGALECIHTYSLIHDDLPAMDNDDLRRGQPTCHKKFSEATAILAGDALLTEAFSMIADSGAGDAATTVRVLSETARAAGALGMVGGQSFDMQAKTSMISLERLRSMHQMKTGALIRLSVVGAAILSGADDARVADAEAFAEDLGLAFQVADDLLDHRDDRPEPGSYPGILGTARAKVFLDELTESCLARIQNWSTTADLLRQIAVYNRTRLI